MNVKLERGGGGACVRACARARRVCERLSKLVQVATLQTCIRKVPSLNIGWDTIISDVFHGFRWSLHSNAGLAP
jgi:hypothetical protein